MKRWPRIAFFKLLLIRKFFSEGLSLNETARSAEISPSSVSRVLNYYYELLERRLPPRIHPQDRLDCHAPHGNFPAARRRHLGQDRLVRPEVISRATLLQLDSAGRTVLDQVLRAWALGAAHGFSGIPSLTNYSLNNGLIPNGSDRGYVWSRNDILSKAALLYFPFLELAEEDALKYLQLSLEGNGVTSLACPRHDLHSGSSPRKISPA